MDARQLKDKAAELFRKGKFAKAAEVYGELCQAEPKDPQLRVRHGDALAKAGLEKEAVEAYRFAAEAYARDGLLPRAIAAAKLILAIDPRHVATQQILADLYGRKATGTSAPAISAPPARPAGPSAPRSVSTQPPAPSLAPRARAGQVLAPPPPPEAARPKAETSDLELDTGDRSAGFEAGARWSAEHPPEPAHTPAAKAPEIEIELEPARAEATAPSWFAPPSDDLPAAGSLEESFQSLESALQDEVELLSVSLEPADAAPPLLPEIPLFSDLPKSAFIELTTRAELRRLQPEELVIEEGSVGSSFFIVCSGTVKVFRGSPAGETLLARLSEGAFFGEMALVSSSPRTASVAAEGEAELLEISSAMLQDLTRRFPYVEKALKKFTRQRLLANVMATSPLFAPFARNDRREIAMKFLARDVAPGTVVVEEGTKSDGLYVVMGGEVEVRKKVQGREQVLAALKEGDVFGEISLLRKSPATATVAAKRKSTLLRLPGPAFDELISTHPQILVLMSELSEERLEKQRVFAKDRPGRARVATEDELVRV